MAYLCEYISYRHGDLRLAIDIPRYVVPRYGMKHVHGLHSAPGDEAGNSHTSDDFTPPEVDFQFSPFEYLILKKKIKYRF